MYMQSLTQMDTLKFQSVIALSAQKISDSVELLCLLILKELICQVILATEQGAKSHRNLCRKQVFVERAGDGFPPLCLSHLPGTPGLEFFGTRFLQAALSISFMETP